MIRNLFGLARRRPHRQHGRPELLHAALHARGFDDAIRSTTPPRPVQRPLFAALAPLARLRGLRGRYADYEHHTGERVDELEERPPGIAALIPALRPPSEGVAAGRPPDGACGPL